MRKCDGIGQTMLVRSARSDNRTNEWPIVYIRTAVVALCFESGVGNVSRQVVVVPSVMIIRVDRSTDRANHRKMMGLLGKQRQMLTALNTGC